LLGTLWLFALSVSQTPHEVELCVLPPNSVLIEPIRIWRTNVAVSDDLILYASSGVPVQDPVDFEERQTISALGRAGLNRKWIAYGRARMARYAA
jgi:hypothetical protein